MTTRTLTQTKPSAAPALLGWVHGGVALVAGVLVAFCGRAEALVALLLALAAGAAELRRALRRDSAQSDLVGAYKLEDKVGEGGMGVVYKASHTLLGRPAAIKFLAPAHAGEQAALRFEREVQVTSRLTHPNTISIYDFGRTAGGAFYYAMEYVDGLDLQTLVERHGPQPPARVAHLLAQLAGALAEAHASCLIHRDVKPANVMVCERGGMLDVVKVLDFGLVKETNARSAATNEGERVVGTPLYLAPEAIAAPDSVDARSDLYALGALGYFLLTGSTPFSGTDVVDVCRQHLHSRPVPVALRAPGPVPLALETLVMRCLAKSRDERPRSAADVNAALLPVAAEWTQQRAASFWARAATASAAAPRASASRAFDVRELAPTVALAA
ncbi:MAG TPA: serine/threonine-protein kinase [Polyangiaceae bacterium]